jgi:hypothetical protein
MADVLSTCVRCNTGLVEVILGMGSGSRENYGEDVLMVHCALTWNVMKNPPTQLLYTKSLR